MRRGIRRIRLKCNPRTLKEAVHWYRQEIQAELRAEVEDSFFWRRGDPEKVSLHDELLEIEQQLEDLIRVD
jgi:hypothetical protein